jgi:hypothetical protein
LGSTGYLDHDRVLDHNGTVARAGGDGEPVPLTIEHSHLHLVHHLCQT